MIFGMYGALIAYIIKEGEFISIIFKPLAIPSIVYSIIFFIIMGALIYKGLKTIEKSELFMVAIILFIVILLTIIGFNKISFENLTTTTNNIFIPYGVILFAFLGVGAIPELRVELRKNPKLVKKAIITGSIIPIIVYALFTLITIGITGKLTTDGAIIGLGTILGHSYLLVGIVFGIFTMATSFIAVALALKEMYCFDFKCKATTSFLLACLVPLIISIILWITGIENPFFVVLNVTGALAGSLTGILIVIIFWRAKRLGNRRPEYVINDKKIIGSALIIIFALGIIHKFLTLFGII